jgi:hypothetical protein
MKPNELRIGNAIQLFRKPTDKKKTYHIIKSIVQDNLSNTCMVELKDGFIVNIDKGIEPIKITPALLRKLGFEDWGRVDSNDYEFYQRFALYNVIDGTSNFEVHLIVSSYDEIEHTQTVFSIDINNRIHLHSSEYLHELQNAFFMVAGYELPINNIF